MKADDPRHGTTRGHSAGCREACCREARNLDEARRRKYRQVLGITRSVDAVGTSRRIRALMAIGWPSVEIARRCGWTTGEAVLEVSRRNWVQTKTAETIERVYDELSMTPGPSRYAERRARAKGWLPPLAWVNIDDPDERPDLTATDDLPDPVVVERILGGDYRLKATPAERAEVVARWTGSRNELARLTGWKVERYGREEDVA